MAEQKDDVSIRHPRYTATEQDREAFADACGGTKALRAKRATYLPQFPLEHNDDYKYRCDSATMLNVTEKTLDTLVGLVFQKDISLGEDVPKRIADLCENIDNRGNHLNVAARDLFDESFDGWACWLVDAPTAVAKDLGEQKSLGLRPYIVKYCADSVTNWDWRVNEVSGKIELSLIVFRESKTAKTGTFKREEEIYYLACFLENGYPFWRRYKETKEQGKETEYVKVGSGTFANQTEIPVCIVGELGDEPPLLDLAFKNFEHAQTYSDYKSIIHKTCVPIPYTTGIDKEDANKAMSGALMWHLPLEGTVAFAEVAGGSIAATRTSLEDNKSEMAWLGLQMLMPKPKDGSRATATEVVSDTLQDTSALQVRATQLKDAIERAFGFMGRYLGLGDEGGGSVELGCSWQQMILSPAELQVWNTMASEGNISLETFLWKLEKAGQLRPDVDAAEELETIKKEQKEIAPIKNAGLMPNEKDTEDQDNPTPAKG